MKLCGQLATNLSYTMQEKNFGSVYRGSFFRPKKFMNFFRGRKSQLFRIGLYFFHSFAFKIQTQMSLNNNPGTQCTNVHTVYKKNFGSVYRGSFFWPKKFMNIFWWLKTSNMAIFLNQTI